MSLRAPNYDPMARVAAMPRPGRRAHGRNLAIVAKRFFE